MANQKLTALTEETTPVDADLFYIVIDTATTPASRKITFQTIKDNIPSSDPAVGTMSNGKISVTVVSNDLVVAVVTAAGATPSASDAVKANIAGTVYTITSALSITIPDATNWFNSGSAELATLAVPYFTYLVDDAGVPALTIGRKSHYTVVESGMATTTSEDHIYGYSGFTDGDDMINIGYFEAVLSAAAGHVWSAVANVISQPTFFSNVMSWNPVFDGFSADPTSLFSRYYIVPRSLFFTHRAGADGTSDATNFTFTLPMTPKNITNNTYQGTANIRDNGASLTSLGRVAFLNSAGNVASVFSNAASGTWTASGGKRIGGMQFTNMEI